MTGTPLGWIGIVRLGLVQTALGAIIVLTTSTLNRVMVVELLLPAMLPGALVTWNHALQLLRPRWGYGSDVGGRRTPWIIGGMAVLASGGVLAAIATGRMAVDVWSGTLLAVAAFTLIGIGVGAAGTSLLVLLAKRVEEKRRPAAANIVWLMMIFGFAVTAGVAGKLLDPFSIERLVAVTAGVSVIAFLVSVVAVWGVEGKAAPSPVPAAAEPKARPAFRQALGEIWAEPQARLFTVFIFVSMLAYSAQDLILEPFAGAVFAYTPGQSTQLSGLQNAGVLVGMVTVAVLGTVLAKGRIAALRLWVVGGCIASALALFSLVVAGRMGQGYPLAASVFALGASNGVYAGAAIAAMMGLAGLGRSQREGVRMGIWGASQAVALGIGGFLGTVAVDALRVATGEPALAYTTVFAVEGVLFLVSAALALRIGRDAPARARSIDAAPELAGAGGR